MHYLNCLVSSDRWLGRTTVWLGGHLSVCGTSISAPTSPDQTFERINSTMEQFGTIDRRENLVINEQRASRHWLSTINGSPASFYGKAIVTATLFQDGTILVLNSVYDPTQAASTLPAIEQIHNSLRQIR